MNRLNLEELLNRFNEIHNNFYKYDNVIYINNKTKIDIVCPIHGNFKQTPSSHLKGSGCPKCKSKKLSNYIFINKLKKIYGDSYDYSLINYINTRTKIKLICPIHGIFEQYPKHLLYSKKGCYKCNNGIKFIKKSNKIHNFKYKYDNLKYENSHIKVKIMCIEHGIFEQLPYHHLRGSGCPKCNDSKGEKTISNYLNNKKIKYIKQKTFKNCKYILPLKFDFYLPEYNVCIEYDGEQHFFVKNIWGGEKEFKLIKKRDKIKNEYCKNNNIHFLRIKYNEEIKPKINNYIKNIT